MQDVTITFTDGPLSGSVQEFEVGLVPIGRQPGVGGLELRNADVSVSRVHAELVELEGGVELRNKSPNGTLVAGKLVLDKVRIEPGVEVAIGTNHVFIINWTSFAVHRKNADADAETDQAAATPGPLASPVTRAIIGVYLLAMIVLAVWLASSGSGDEVASNDWPVLQEAYEAYEPNPVSTAQRAEHLARAEVLLREIRALKTQGATKDVAPACREIMGLESDPNSPLFQYGVKCLASAKSKGLFD